MEIKWRSQGADAGVGRVGRTGVWEADVENEEGDRGEKVEVSTTAGGEGVFVYYETI